MNSPALKTVVSIGVPLLVAIFCRAEIENQLWAFQTGDAIFSSPTIDSSGNVYFGSIDGKVYSMDKDGNERWSVLTGDWVESSASLSPDESVVYIGSWDNKLYAVAAGSGSVLWTYDTGSLIFSSPAVANDGKIYFGGSDGFLYALNSSGNLLWDVFVEGELDSSVAIGPAGNLFVASSDGKVYAFDRISGAELWSFEVPTEIGALGRETQITSSCMLDGSGALYFGCNNHYVYSLDTSNGSVLWKYETGGIVEASPTLSIDGNVLISSQDGFLYSLDTNGELVWQTQIGANYYTSAVVDEIGRIYVSSFINDNLSYLNLLSGDGTVLQQMAFSGIIDSSVALSPDGVLYFGNNDGKLYAYSNAARLSNSVWPKFHSGSAGRGSLEGYSPPVANKERLYNIALRGTPSGGEADIIAGFAIGGTGEKSLLVRAVGPGLLSQGVTDYLEDPQLNFHHWLEGEIGENNDWGQSASAGILPQEMARVGAFSLETGSTDSADLLTLESGAVYTAIVSNAGGDPGIALVEVYNADEGESTSVLSNVSMRGPVGTGDEVLIAGFFIEGNLPKRLLIRAVGTGLISQGVVNALSDPTLSLYRGASVIESNDDWDLHPERAQLEAFMDSAGAFELAEGSGDSAMFVWLEPGLYTAIISGVNSATGIALVEIYDLTGK